MVERRLPVRLFSFASRRLQTSSSLIRPSSLSVSFDSCCTAPTFSMKICSCRRKRRESEEAQIVYKSLINCAKIKFSVRLNNCDSYTHTVFIRTQTSSGTACSVLGRELSQQSHPSALFVCEKVCDRHLTTTTWCSLQVGPKRIP